MNDNKPILRYNANERTNHWIVAIPVSYTHLTLPTN